MTLIVLLVVIALAWAPSVAASPTGESDGRPRVAIAFVPGPPPKVKPAMISRLAAGDEFAFGFASAIQGSYRPEQTLLDIGAGSRVWTSLYDGELPEQIQLRAVEGEGTISGWAQIRSRARTPPADIVPGLLAETVSSAGLGVAYVGLEGRRNREALVAAAVDGHLETVALEPRADVGAEAVRQLRSAALVVVRLPAGRHGSRALAALRAARRPQDLLLLVEQPSGVGRRLLALAAAGLSGGRNLRSDTTRTDGLVSSTDIAPTAIERLGLGVPDDVTGRPIEAAGNRTAEDLTEMKDRFAEVGPRRWLVVLGGLAGAALLGGIAATGGSGHRLRGMTRAAFLAALWLPPVLLVTGALAPSRLGEVALIAGACATGALATDRFLPWPQAIALPAVITVLSHVMDLALGSELIQRSLLGPNPILGARFYGVGNELEVTLGVIGLLGLGALLARAARRRIVWGFVAGGTTLALTLSWGKLGADVGASVMLAAGTAAAAVAGLGQRPGKSRIALIVAAPVVALAALAALDIVSGGDAHFTRSVLDAGGLGELADIAQRRVELSYRSLTRGIVGLLVLLAVVALIWGVRSRRRLLAPLSGTPGLFAGLVGAFVAVVVGALSNDSGPMILLIGTCYLWLAVGYLQVAPKTGAKQPFSG